MTDDTRLIVPALDAEPWPTLGPEVCDFIEDNLVYGPGDLLGQPMRLMDEERLFFYRAYEVWPSPEHPAYDAIIASAKTRTDREQLIEYAARMECRRRFKREAYSRRKGLSKTEKAACMAIVEGDPNGPVRCDGWRVLDGELVPVGRPVVDPYIPMLAFTEEQVEELAYRAVYEILSHCALGDEYDLTLDRIQPKDSPGRIVALAGSPSARDGARTTFQHFDEPHRMISPRLKQAVQTMLRNVPKRKAADAHTLETSTMYGPNEGSVFEDTHTYALAVVRGEVKDPTLLFDHRQASEKWDLSKDRELMEAIREASGDAVAWSDLDSIKGRFRDPTADENEERRYWLNQRRASSRKWAIVQNWANLAAARDVPEGAEIVLAFDGSYNRDSTVLVGATVEAKPYVFLVEAWEKPLLHAARWRVNRNDVIAAIDAALAKWDVVEFAPDPPGWQREIEDLEEEYGETVVRFETKQTARMAPAIDDFEQAVKDGMLSQDGSEVLARHLSNVVPVFDKLDKVVAIRKEFADSPNKIDAAVGAVVAYHRARWHYAHEAEDVGAFVIDLNKREAA